MKIALVMIARDADTTLRACLESVAPYVDEINIGLAGMSKDDTGNVALDFTDRILDIDWTDDFAAARNEIWKRISPDCDVAIWLDADDILINGDRLRSALERNPESNCLQLPYHYEQDEFGNLSCTLDRERVVRNPEQWHWEGAIHEVLVLDEQVPYTPVRIPDIIVKHNPDRPRAHKQTRNLDILYRELERTEPKPSQRLLFYLGRENAARGNLKEATQYLNRYISQAATNDEAYQVAVLLGETLRAQGQGGRARGIALRAITIQPTWPDAFLLLARIAFEDGAYQECIEWTKAASTKAPPETSLIVDPRAYDYWPLYYLGLAYYQVGDWEAAINNLRMAAAISPGAELLGTISSVANEKQAQDVLAHFMAVYEHLGRNDEWLKVRKLFEVAPKILEQHPDVMEAWRKTAMSTEHIVNPQVMVDYYRDNPGWAPMPDEAILSDGWRNHPRMAFARKALCAPPKWILDVGCSDGFMSLPLAKEGYNVFGMDLDPHCINLANSRAEQWNVPAKYAVGSVDDLNETDRYDVALACEIIEHLVDPGAFLDKLDAHANKVVLTTPHLAWERGNLRDWDKVEPKGHIRIFDESDVERLLTGRGQIVDLYREPWGESGWVFASYYPGRTATGTVTFLSGQTIEPWGPRTLKAQGLGGSETALIKLSEELAVLGKRVSVFGRIDSPGYYNAVAYRQNEHFIGDVRQDTVVAWRMPEAADMNLNTTNLVLWMHDTDVGDRLTMERAFKFSSIVVLSQWHKQHMLKVYPWLSTMEVDIVVIGNGVDPVRFLVPEVVERDPKRVVYTSSPDRGLDVVLEHIWPKVVEAVPDAELHIYYGWGNFEKLKATRPDLAEFQRKCADLIMQTTNVVQHGRVNQDQLAEELRKASIWLYPTYFDETYCISAVEAQLAGCIPVTNTSAALAEVVPNRQTVLDYSKGGNPVDDAQKYADMTIVLLKASDEALDEARARIVESAPTLSWEDVAAQWRDNVLT